MTNKVCRFRLLCILDALALQPLIQCHGLVLTHVFIITEFRRKLPYVKLTGPSMTPLRVLKIFNTLKPYLENVDTVQGVQLLLYISNGIQ